MAGQAGGRDGRIGLALSAPSRPVDTNRSGGTMATSIAAIGLLLLLAAPVQARADDGLIPVHARFLSALEAEGLEAAVARLEAMLADSTGAYAVNGYELGIALPRQLRREGRSEAALALLTALEQPFGSHDRYWGELALHHLHTGDLPAAERAWRRSLEIRPDQPQLVWMLANGTRLVETIVLQKELADRWAPGENTELQGPYLGQKPPGDEPEVFAPGILNTLEHEYSIAFSPDAREIYFSRSSEGTFVCRWEEEGWTAPELVVLIDEEHLTEEASVSPNGRRIYFCARPRDLRGPREIHVAERQDEGWGEARHLFTGMYPTATLDGTLYYTEITGRPDYGVLVRRRAEGDSFGEIELLPEAARDTPTSVNTSAVEGHPFVTADERLLIFDSMRAPSPASTSASATRTATGVRSKPSANTWGSRRRGRARSARTGATSSSASRGTCGGSTRASCGNWRRASSSPIHRGLSQQCELARPDAPARFQPVEVDTGTHGSA